MAYEIKYNNNNALIEFSGSVDFEELMESANSIISSPSFDDMKYQCWNYHKIDEFLLLKDDIYAIAALDKQSTIWNIEMKMATVTNDPFIKELFTLYMELMKDTKWQFSIFDGLNEAINWCES